MILIDAETGHIVYSVYKEVDVGSDLRHGPYRQSSLAAVCRRASEAESADVVALADFQPYEPSYLAPASFVATPIFRDGEKYQTKGE